MFLAVLGEVVGQESTQIPSADNIIGIGGIIATVVVGILTCLVTWKMTMKSIKQKRLSYNIQLYPILSNSIAKKGDAKFEDLNITYKGRKLQNPCLLTVEIINTGNEAIKSPPIRISNDEGIEIVPGYFEDVPDGYEGLWKLSKTDQSSCEIILDHINPKQIVKARFFLADFPVKEIKFICPMPNVQTQEVAYSDEHKKAIKSVSYSKANLVLIAITVLLFISIDRWGYYFTELAWRTYTYMAMAGTVLFVMSVPLLAIILNAYGIPKIDLYLRNHRKQRIWIMMGLLLASIIFLVLIIFNYGIIGLIPQSITAIVVVIMLALLIHFALIAENR